VPEALVHRVIQRESSYNPRASSQGNFGLMQIRYDTARGMGYRGPASGLLDANTNLTYAVPYLANAYRVAGGSHDRAVSLYAGGYYYVAKRKGSAAGASHGGQRAGVRESRGTFLLALFSVHPTRAALGATCATQTPARRGFT
jgi:soluble lytic murein transglycosylase-like protein